MPCSCSCPLHSTRADRLELQAQHVHRVLLMRFVLCSKRSTSEVSTYTGRKCRASRLLGLRDAMSDGVGRRQLAEKHGIDLTPSPTLHLYRHPNELPSWMPLRNPKPCLTRVQLELGFQPLKRATLWVHAHIDVAQVLLLGH